MKLTTLKKAHVIFCLTHMCTAYHGWTTDDPMSDPEDTAQSSAFENTADIGGAFEIISNKETNDALQSTSLQQGIPSQQNSLWTRTLGLVFSTQKPSTNTPQSTQKKATKSDIPRVDSAKQEQLLSAPNTDELIAEHSTTLTDELASPENTSIIHKETGESVLSSVASIQSQAEYTDESDHEGEIDSHRVDPSANHFTDLIGDHLSEHNADDVVPLIPELITDEDSDQTETRKIDNSAIANRSNIASQQHTIEPVLIEPLLTVGTNRQSTDRLEHLTPKLAVSEIQQEGEGSSFFTTATVVAAVGFSAIILPHLLKQWGQK